MKEVKEKGIMLELQAEFRKSKWVIDNIYVMNYLVGRKLKSKKKMVNFRAAFDSDRRILGKKLEGISRILEKNDGDLQGDEICSKGGREVGGEILDRKRGEAGVSTEFDVIQCANSGSRERIGKQRSEEN